jgi:alpha-tubulin suppressor-like RCC1 family protein
MAIKNDGTLWAWGSNNDGRLGLNNTTSNSSPVQVGSLNNWAHVMPGSGSFSLAIKTDGTLWSWGLNGSGQLGLGDTTNRSSPVQVGSLTDWAYAGVTSAGSFALKTDGTIWAWGTNSSGQLGLGDTTNRSSPVQIGSINTWLDISTAPFNQSSFGIKP